MADTKPTTKTCTRCNLNLPETDFYRKRNGRESKCKTCLQRHRKEQEARRANIPCSIESCSGDAKRKGMCDRHYRRALAELKPKVMPSNPCACGCGGLTKSTYMTGHHRKVKGASAPVPAKPVDERIRQSSTIQPNGCWTWNLSTDSDGYGSIKVAGKTRYAARVSYEVFVDDVPEGMVVHQVCKDRSCVNPDHLETITRKESTSRGALDPLKNFADYYAKRRAATHCPKGHPWDEENTRHNGIQRVCRTCLREGARARREDVDFAQSERDRNRELYEENREEILARKRSAERSRREKAIAEGRCTHGSGACDSPAQPGYKMCKYHRELHAARMWGIHKHPMREIYALRGIEVCWICGCDFGDDVRFHNDHLIPRSLGGPDEPWNLAPACPTCNCRRGNLPLNVTMKYAEYSEEATRDFPIEYRSYLS